MASATVFGRAQLATERDAEPFDVTRKDAREHDGVRKTDPKNRYHGGKPRATVGVLRSHCYANDFVNVSILD